jgi:TRAP-type C4-dicarboxylate transport system permease small subunit
MKIIKRPEAIFDGVVDGMAFFAAVLIVLLMLFISIDVILRYFFSRPLFWMHEMAEYALLYITFTGTAWLLKDDAHVKVDILMPFLSSNKKRVLDIAVGIIGIFICVVLTYEGVKVAWDHLERGVHSSTLLSFPKGPLLAIIPIGTFLLLIQFIRRTMTSLKKR